MGILQPEIPVRRMASERKTKLNDALARILRRFLTPATVTLLGLHDLRCKNMEGYCNIGSPSLMLINVC